jgi:Mg-chelatase subunit ChlD
MKNKMVTAMVLSTLILVLAAFKTTNRQSVSKSQRNVIESPVVVKPAVKTESADQQSKIQVVFSLDCTGSMSGLIQAAKDKIWSIATGLSQADPKPDISIGFLFYRDRGDAFVTKQVALTNDLDMAYKELMDMSANGGGDMPESVNQALHESVKDFQWDASKDVYKVIFLVGDAPPHMDYANDSKYQITCNEAVKKDIVINTIQCGDIRETTPVWSDIAQRAGGEFLRLSQTGSEVVIKCPHDEDIARHMSAIDETRLYYGAPEVHIEMKVKTKASEKINTGAAKDVLAKRAEYNYTNSTNKSAYMGKNELVTAIESGKVKIEDIKAEELPENMRSMSMEERKAFINQIIAKRKKNEAELAQKLKEREKYVAEETKKLKADAIDNSFSGNVHKVIVKQAESKNIKIDKKVKN